MEGQEKRKKKRHNKVTFKPYSQNQGWLLPPSLGDLIPATHIARLVNGAIDGMDLAPVLNTYEGGGSSNYHPRMMLKALVFGYIEKIYSSREIEKALKENICFMWLCGMEQPDHNTLNRFRNSQLKKTIKDVFAQVLLLLIEQGRVRLNDYFIDGTKMESVAGRYTFVWAKNVERYKSGLLDKIAILIEQIEGANKQTELEASQQKQSVPKISDSEALSQTIKQLNEQLHDQLGENKQLKKKLDTIANKHLPKLQAYEAQEELLDGRSSYSKTDPEATFMRTKEDHLGNGQLKPCYNVQVGTEDQFIINYTVHQTPSDMVVFTDHMDDTIALLDSIEVPHPKRIGADAGYGSQENYQYAEQKDFEAYIKYPGYYKEQKGIDRKYPFHRNTLYYSSRNDFYVCPMGQKMLPCKTQKQTTKTGFKQSITIYKAQCCEGCPLRGQCHKAEGKREIKRNHAVENYHQKARTLLHSLRGIRMRKQRNIDVEAVFGHIKQDRQFRRFMLTGLDGVSTEIGLLAIAHNFKKWWQKIQNQGIPVSSPPTKPILSAQNQIKVA